MGTGRETGTGGGVNMYRDQLITIADLIRFEETLLSKIQGLLKDFSGSGANKWLKTYEVKKLLNISPGTLQHLRDSGTLPYTRIGGVIYYKLADIESMLSARSTANPSLGINRSGSAGQQRGGRK